MVPIASQQEAPGGRRKEVEALSPSSHSDPPPHKERAEGERAEEREEEEGRGEEEEGREVEEGVQLADERVVFVGITRKLKGPLPFPSSTPTL